MQDFHCVEVIVGYGLGGSREYFHSCRDYGVWKSVLFQMLIVEDSLI